MTVKFYYQHKYSLSNTANESCPIRLKIHGLKCAEKTKLQKTQGVSTRKQKVQGLHCKFGELDSCSDNIIPHLPQTLAVCPSNFYTNTHIYIQLQIHIKPTIPFSDKILVTHLHLHLFANKDRERKPSNIANKPLKIDTKSQSFLIFIFFTNSTITNFLLWVCVPLG